jgi:tetratricopeptide (TPR) repeat protein
LRPGNVLVLHTHMQPSGKVETVRFRVGIHYADQPPSERPLILRIGSRVIDVPPGEKDHVVTDEYQLPIDVDVQFVFPHAHSLCRELRVKALLPDGGDEPVIWIRGFDENWHDQYRFAKPLRLPAGTRLESTFVYDNSADNLRNPNDPPRRVVYGSNADDEMADIYLQATPVDPLRRAVLLEHYNHYDLESKIAGYLKTLEVHPDDNWSREALASCYIVKKQPSDALRLLPELEDSGEEAVHSLVIRAMAYLANGEHLHAQDLLRQALKQDPLYAIAWLGLGQTLVAGNDPTEAERAFRRAVELAPGLTAAHLDLADLSMSQSQFDDAASACEAAIASVPEESKPYLKLAEIRAVQSRYDECLQLLETAQELAPYTYAPKVSLAVFCYQNGEEDRPRQLLEEAVQDSPKDPVAHLYLGQIARRDEKLEQARDHLQQAASLATPLTWPESHRRQFLGLVYLERFQLAQQLEDLDLAREVVSAWIEIEPENSKLRELYNQLLAE